MKYSVKKIGNMSVKVIINEDMSSCEGSISSSDAEMDKRAVAAVRSAIYRAKVCKKPIARYDVATKRALCYNNVKKFYDRFSCVITGRNKAWGK